MPASPKVTQGFLPPYFPIAYVRSVGLATIEQISHGIRIAGIDDANSLNKKVRRGLTSDEAKSAGITFVTLQIHPRAMEDVQVLSRTSAQTTPPEDIYRALEENWLSFTGCKHVDIFCLEADAETLRPMAKEYQGQSEPISGLILQPTRRNQIAKRVGDSNFHWQALPLRKSPSSDFCGIASYEVSGQKKTVVCFPVAQHWMPQDEGDWEKILRDDVERARQYAKNQSAVFEICGPWCESCYWPESSPPVIRPITTKE